MNTSQLTSTLQGRPTQVVAGSQFRESILEDVRRENPHAFPTIFEHAQAITEAGFWVRAGISIGPATAHVLAWPAVLPETLFEAGHSVDDLTAIDGRAQDLPRLVGTGWDAVTTATLVPIAETIRRYQLKATWDHLVRESEISTTLWREEIVGQALLIESAAWWLTRAEVAPQQMWAHLMVWPEQLGES